MIRKLAGALSLVVLAACGPDPTVQPLPAPSVSVSATPTASATIVPEPPSSPAGPLPTVGPPPVVTRIIPIPLAALCAKPTVCTIKNSAARLTITKPGVYDGQQHTVPGILIQSSNVTVKNFRVEGGRQAGIWSEGVGNTIQGNHITGISFGEDDVDGIRFFGDNTKIVGNIMENLIRGPIKGAHPDACQTWVSSSHPKGSSNVVIQGNQFKGFDFHQGITVEGRNTGGNHGGAGPTSHWKILDNYIEGTSNQTVVLRGVSDVEVRNNVFAGHIRKAVQIAEGSKNVRFAGNVIPKGAKLSGD